MKKNKKISLDMNLTVNTKSKELIAKGNKVKKIFLKIIHNQREAH